MNKKAGIVWVIAALVLISCCLGTFFFAQSFTKRITETMAKDQKFVTTVLTSCTKTWDEDLFSKSADESFNTPAKRAETQKLFATLKEHLGGLVSLGDVTFSKEASRSNNNGTAQGFFVSFTAKAKFEKGNGIFTVTVKNIKDQMKIYTIGLDPDKSVIAPPSGSKKP